MITIADQFIQWFGDGDEKSEIAFKCPSWMSSENVFKCASDHQAIKLSIN